MADRVIQVGSTGTVTNITDWLSLTSTSTYLAVGNEVCELVDTYYTEAVVFFNATATTTVDKRRIIRPHSSNRYDPSDGTGAQVTVDGPTYALRYGEEYCRCEGFRINQIGAGHFLKTTGGDHHEVDSLYLYANVASNLDSAFKFQHSFPSITNCIFVGNNTTETLSGACISLNNASGTGTCVNNIVTGWTRAGGNGVGIKNGFGAANIMENNIVAECDQNFAFGNAVHDYNACDNNETSGEGSGLTTQSLTLLFDDWASNDFALKAGSNAIDAGNDNSPFLTTDYNGDTRTGTWDMGAIMETVAAGNTYTIENLDNVYVTEGGFESGVIPPTEGGEDSMVLGASGGNTPGVDDIAILIEGMRIAEGTY